VVEEFNKLTQEKKPKEFVERFEELKSLMSILNPSLSKSYYVSSFISGLENDNMPILKILRLTTIIYAFDQARWQEKSSLEIISKNIFISRMPSSFNGSRPPSNLFFKT
jgi:5-methylcytosine-specific restriction endonuclease McrBC GTP-binding regulatory subunit McrB